MAASQWQINLALGMGKKTVEHYRLVGWREWVALPNLGILALKAKIDTGARTSALHAIRIHPYEHNGIAMVRFQVHPQQRSFHQTIMAEAKIVDHRHVRNSGGQSELRPVIQTTVVLGTQQWPIELTLTNRDAMGFRMLLGRQAIRGHFFVDAGRSFLQARPATLESIERIL
jgi:hypothetical protein